MCVSDHVFPQDLDDESVIETVDFTEFEKLFQVVKKSSNMGGAKLRATEGEWGLGLVFSCLFKNKLLDNCEYYNWCFIEKQKSPEELSLIETRRSRNLSECGSPHWLDKALSFLFLQLLQSAGLGREQRSSVKLWYIRTSTS